MLVALAEAAILASVLHTLTSSCLLRYGRYLSRYRTRLSKALHGVQVMAHRGCKDVEGGPVENTVAAFRYAIDHEAHMVELDVRLSSDGQVVVFHDADFSRMCGCGGLVAETRFEDFPPLRGGAGDRRIPLLGDVLEVLPRETCLNVEFKVGQQELVEKVHGLLEAGGRLDGLGGGEGRTVWFSLQQAINRQLRAKDPRIPIITSTGEVFKTSIAFWCGVLPYLSLQRLGVDADIFGVPADPVDFARIRSTPFCKALPDAMCRVLERFIGGSPSPFFLDARLNSHLNRRGVPVCAMGCVSDEALESLDGKGVSILLADDPAWIRRRLGEQPIELARCSPAA